MPKRGAPQKSCAICGKKVHARTKTCPFCKGNTSKGPPATTGANGHTQTVVDDADLRGSIEFAIASGGIANAVKRIQKLVNLQQDLNKLS